MGVPTLKVYAKESHCIEFHMPMTRDRRRREEGKHWVVQRKHAKWEPSDSSVICSKHFKEDFTHRFVGQLPVSESLALASRLKSDEIGICLPFEIPRRNKHISAIGKALLRIVNNQNGGRHASYN